MISYGLVGQGVKTSTLNITFELAVPDLGIELEKPLAKRSKVCRLERSNLLFDLLNPCHDINLPHSEDRGRTIGPPAPLPVQPNGWKLTGPAGQHLRQAKDR
jgi:hypothetical protein